MNLHLSFDDGPNEIWTPQILDLLAAHDAKATFFVVGQSLFGREEILERVAAEGHTVGNHTFMHPRLSTLRDFEIEREFAACNSAVKAVLGFAPSFWRAPYFDANDATLVMARHCGLIVNQNHADIIPEDCFTSDALIIAERVLEGARNSTAASPVVCLHDGIPPDGGSASCTQSRQPTVDAVRIILETLA